MRPVYCGPTMLRDRGSIFLSYCTTEALQSWNICHHQATKGERDKWFRHRRFRHNDLTHLESLLQQDIQKYGHTFAPLILVESLYSMDGDGPDLQALGKISEKYQAILYMDDAHSAGGYGPDGKGLPAMMNPSPDIIMGTCSKAFGSYGSYILCADDYRDYLINKAGGFIYTTAIPPALLGALDAALDVIPTLSAERAYLHLISQQLRQHCQTLGLDTAGSISHIVPIVLGSEQRMLSWAERLRMKGFLVGAIRPPTVAVGSARLRISLSALLHRPDFDHFLSCLSDIADTEAAT